MGYGVLQSYGISLQTELVDAKNHGLLKLWVVTEMGYDRVDCTMMLVYPSPV